MGETISARRIILLAAGESYIQLVPLFKCFVQNSYQSQLHKGENCSSSLKEIRV